MKRFIFIQLFFICAFSLSALAQEKTNPVVSILKLDNRNQTEDYFSKGITNYELDVLYIYGELYVGSEMPDSIGHKLPTLRDAFLMPLYNEYKKNGNKLLKDNSSEVYVFINLKYEGNKTYANLWEELSPFQEMLTRKIGTQWKKSAVKIVLTGHTPTDQLEIHHATPVVIEGSYTSEFLTKDNMIVPVIGIDYSTMINWNGLGNMPYDQFAKIQEIFKKIHAKGKKIRVYDCPDQKSVWDALLSCGVDFVTTTAPSSMNKFIASRK